MATYYFSCLANKSWSTIDSSFSLIPLIQYFSISFDGTLKTHEQLDHFQALLPPTCHYLLSTRSVQWPLSPALSSIFAKPTVHPNKVACFSFRCVRWCCASAQNTPMSLLRVKLRFENCLQDDTVSHYSFSPPRLQHCSHLARLVLRSCQHAPALGLCLSYGLCMNNPSLRGLLAHSPSLAGLCWNVSFLVGVSSL